MLLSSNAVCVQDTSSNGDLLQRLSKEGDWHKQQLELMQSGESTNEVVITAVTMICDLCTMAHFKFHLNDGI